MIKIIVKLLIISVLFIASSTVIRAQNAVASVSANPSNTHEGIWLEANKEVTLISKTITNDAYVAGGDVYVDTVIQGDLLTIGGKIQIDGIVDGAIRAVGGVVNINGEVKGNVSVVGGQVRIGPKAVLHRSLLIAGGKVDVFGQIDGDVKIVAGKVLTNASSTGNWEIRAKDIMIDNDFSSQNLTYHSPQKAQIAQTASVSGQIKYIPDQLKNYQFNPVKIEGLGKFISKAFLLGRIIEFGFILIVGLVLLRLFPRQFNEMLLVLDSNFLHLMFKGILILIIISLIILVMIITILGIPFAILTGLLFWLLLFLAKILGSLVVGRWLLLNFNMGERRGWAFALGAGLYLILGFLPVIGFVYRLVVLSAATGMLYLYWRKDHPSLNS